MMNTFLRLLTTFSLFSALAPTGFATELPPGLTKECTDFIASLPNDVQYGFISAPEDWDHPSTSPKIPIFYYTKNLAELQRSNKVPIAYFNGGPGFSTHSAYRRFNSDHIVSLKLMEFPPAKGVPFFYIDQRGTGCSGTLPTVPLTLAGVERLGRFGTRNTVRDAEAIRARVFGDRKWNLFGQSYGTAIVHRYVALAPNSVHRAFAHGLSMMSEGFWWSEYRILAQKRVGEAYLRKYPGDEEIAKRVRAQIPADYCVGSRAEKTCGPALLDAVLSNIGFTSLWDEVHKTIAPLLTPSGDLNRKYLEALIPPGLDEAGSIPSLMVMSIENREMPGGYLQSWSCKLATDDAIRRGEKPSTWFLNECRLVEATRAVYTPYVHRLIAQDYLTIESLERGLRINPALELHLYAGGLDSFSPYEGTFEVRRKLGNRIQFTNFPNTGHDWSNNPQIWDDLKR